MTHLDTSFLVDLLRERNRGVEGPAGELLTRLSEEPLAVGLHVVCELYAGAELSKDPETERRRVDTLLSGVDVVLPDRDFAAVYGRLLASMSRRGQRIATMDLLIAAAAVLAGSKLVTRNIKHFKRVPGLELVGY